MTLPLTGAGRSGPRRVTFWVGECGDVAYTTVEVEFTEAINSTNYKAGVTIRVNAVSRVIDTATRQADRRFVYYVVASAVDVNDTLSFEYDDALGDYENDLGTPMVDVVETGCDNWVGSHLYFDTEDDCVWVGAV